MVLGSTGLKSIPLSELAHVFELLEPHASG